MFRRLARTITTTIKNINKKYLVLMCLHIYNVKSQRKLRININVLSVVVNANIVKVILSVNGL